MDVFLVEMKIDARQYAVRINPATPALSQISISKQHHERSRKEIEDEISIGRAEHHSENVRDSISGSLKIKSI